MYPLHIAQRMLLVYFSLWSVCQGEIVWRGQKYTCFSAFQCHSNASDGYFTPVHIRLDRGCMINPDTLFQEAQPNTAKHDLVAVVVWKEAVAAGCFSFAQVTKHIRNATETSNIGFRVVVFGSAVDSNAHFGSPIVEPYGSLRAVDSGYLPVLLTAASSAELLTKALVGLTVAQSKNLYLQRDPGPWNNLIESTGFKTHQYLFLAISIMLILYTFWEIGLMLCTLTVWNRRMLMYLSAIGYLIIFTLIHPYSINSRAAEIIIYVSWIAGYICLTLFIVFWGTTVQSIPALSNIAILNYQRAIHYTAAITMSLTILVKLWAFAAKSYQFAAIANAAVAYEFPVIFGIQTILLGLLIWTFLYHTFGIAISMHTKSVLHNVAILCIVSLVGCMCMAILSIVIISPAKYTVRGYEAIVVLYELGQCLLFITIFGALLVRDRAKRTRSLFHQHEFYVEPRSQPLQPLARDTSPPDDSNMAIDSCVAININYPQLSDHQSNSHSPTLASHAGELFENGHCSSNISEIDNCSQAITPPLTVVLEEQVGANHITQNKHSILPVERKASKRHVYVSLEPVLSRKFCNNY